MKKILISSFVLFAFVASAQEIPLFSQYLNNDFILNPAISGTKEYAPASISARTQWANFKGAPATQIGSIHGAMTKNVGIGAAVMNFTAGPTKMNSVQFAYAYRFKVSDKMKLSFGVAPMIIQQSLSKDKLTLDEANDNTINRISGKTMVADVNAGIYAYTNKFFISFSVPQLMANKLRVGDDFSTEHLKRHYILYSGYDVKLKEKYTITPSVLIKAIEGGAPVQVDVNVKAMYNNLCWIGLSYRGSSSKSLNEAAVAFVGVQKFNFVFGYAYDYGFSSMRTYSMGSHEVFLTYRIPCKNAEKPIGTSAKETQ